MTARLKTCEALLRCHGVELTAWCHAWHPENESARLKALRELEEQAYDDLAAMVAQIAGVPIALVSLIDKDRQWFKSHHALAARETPRE